MEQKSNEFFVNLNTLKKAGDKKLKEFAINEELNVEDIIDIIYKEADRIKEKNKVKVIFETLEDDSFRIVVTPLKEMYKGTIIYPFTKIKSESKEILLDDIFGRMTLYNRKNLTSQLTVTIDGVALDLFSMTYSKAKELLINISDRRTENGYIEDEMSISFKEYGVKLNKKKDTNEIESIDVYNNEAFFNEFKFIEKKEEKYDVDITKVVVSSDYKVPEFKVENLDDELDDEFDIEIDIPKKESNNIKSIEDKQKVLEDKLSERLKKFSLSTVQNEISSENKEERVESKIISEEIKEEEEKNNYNNELKKEIDELTKLYEKQKEQQEILENRISTKLEELKKLSREGKTKRKDSKEKIIESSVENVEKIDVQQKEDKKLKSYIIESYKGIKQQGKNSLSVFFGESREDIRNYFRFVPKKVDEYNEMEVYGNFYAYYDYENKCTGIGIYNQEKCKNEIALYLFGKNLITMTYKDIVKLIKDHDYKAIEDEDGIISLEYGISVDPREEKDYKNKICDVIHIFKKGYYDEVYNI